jgi:hypothetical protein
MEGVYRLIVHRFDGQGQQHDRTAGRFLIHQNVLVHLEDHSGNLEHWFPQGVLTARTTARLQDIGRSGYYELLHEDHVNEGHHPDRVEEMELGPVQPEAVFTLNGEGLPAPELVEVWADAIEVGGRRLGDREAADLMDKVRAGTLVLTPVE